MTLDGEPFATGEILQGVARFDFGTLRLGEGCSVTLKGSRPLLLAAEDIEIDTALVAPPGTFVYKNASTQYHLPEE